MVLLVVGVLGTKKTKTTYNKTAKTIFGGLPAPLPHIPQKIVFVVFFVFFEVLLVSGPKTNKTMGCAKNRKTSAFIVFWCLDTNNQKNLNKTKKTIFWGLPAPLPHNPQKIVFVFSFQVFWGFWP